MIRALSIIATMLLLKMTDTREKLFRLKFKYNFIVLINP